MDNFVESTTSSHTTCIQRNRSAMLDRDKLIDAAITHFYRNGCRQTPISEIMATAGVPMDVLDENFDSMEELVVAALEKWDRNCHAWLISEMQERGESTKEQVLGLFDALFEWFQSADYRGCLFINAAVEYSSQRDPVHQVAAAHKHRFAQHVEHLLARSGASSPKVFADQLMLVMEGALVTTHTVGTPDAGRVAREMAERILQDALPNNA